jgi:ComF family protein
MIFNLILIHHGETPARRFSSPVVGKYILKMRNTGLTVFLNDFVSLFFPRYCLSCRGALVKGEDMICTVCMLEMPQTDFHIKHGNSLRERLQMRIPLMYAMALFRFSKSGRVQEMLHTLKYKNQPELGVSLGKMYGEKLVSTGYHASWDMIVPVPLHASRMRKRGYNQSSKFAEGLSEKLHVPVVENVLTRKVKTETQTKKSKLNRWENVKSVFEIGDALFPPGNRVLLVDDVVTTGATLEACTWALLMNGCQSVSIACIAEA